ncbi:MAG: hypothetical protein QG555_1327 [Thermodesulfobacteriota bacterium]|nr:hypothetical protein [Thermodesulfobacteriota bacterium]
MGTMHKTGCVLCPQNCGLIVEVEDNRIVKVRGDKTNVRSEGYLCRKGMNIAWHQHNADRLQYPLKRTATGFARISWEEALGEIAAKLTGIIGAYGPRSFAYMGGGGQGCHFEAAFGVRFMRALGSRYHYSALAQELTGLFWVHGRALGRQYLGLIPDETNTDLLLAIGWNSMQSHQMAQATRHLQRLAKDPEKLLVVIDPRVSETAKIADIHLAVRPGTDALLLKAIIAVILQEGWENRAYIGAHTAGFDEVSPWFRDFDARAAIAVCELDYDRVYELSRLLATRRWSCHYDLGIMMNRHSTVSSWLAIILLAICGRIGVRGGNVFPGHLMPLGAHSDERNPKSWRTVTTNFPPIMGVYPPNVMPEEIISDHPERLRAVLVSGSNPLRSYADTTAYEEAFGKLDLLVTCELAMTETARLSHYILPARSAYESWDGTFFAWTFPGIFFQMRRPIVPPTGEPRDLSEIMLGLAGALDVIPPIPDALYEAARQDRQAFAAKLFEYALGEPQAMKMMPFILGKTLGPVLGSVNLAALWGMLQILPKDFINNAGRAGFAAVPNLGDELFRQLVERPEGLWIGQSDRENNLENLRTEGKKIELMIPELADWLRSIDADSETIALKGAAAFPLVLMAGRHFDKNANTLMRNPAWNQGKRDCTLLMHPADAAELGIVDGETVRIVTAAGTAEIELEVTNTARKGHVVIPHGFGLVYDGKAYGINVNRLTKNTHRDAWAATPLHRYVPCRVERLWEERILVVMQAGQNRINNENRRRP